MMKLGKVKKIRTITHKCPYVNKILSCSFKCENLKFKNGEFFCKICRCPYDNKEYEQETYLEIY